MHVLETRLFVRIADYRRLRGLRGLFLSYDNTRIQEKYT